jgi:hypothetical protein
MPFDRATLEIGTCPITTRTSTHLISVTDLSYNIMKKLIVLTSMIVALVSLCALVFYVMLGPFAPQPGGPPAEKPAIDEMRAREIAQDDAKQAYGDLSAYDVKTVLENDGWHIDYELKEKSSEGGGPHYLIDPHNGKIIKKKYEQ